MTGDELNTLFQKISLDISIDETTFYQMLGMVQTKIEAKRDWMILRASDASESAGPGDTFTSPKTIPSDFFFWQSEDPIVLVEPANSTNLIPYLEVPFAKRFVYQFQAYRFFCDYKNSRLYLGGIVDRTYMIYKNYIYKPDTITKITSWVFPAQFHPILAYGVAAIWKLGTDFDNINMITGDQDQRIFLDMLKTMEIWDSRMAQGSLEGVDRRMNEDLPGFVSGHINIYD